MTAKKTFIAFQTLFTKEIVRFTRIWVQTLLPPVVTMTLYYIIFGTFIGSQISDINGYTYMQFIMPGLVMMAVITNTYSNVVSSFFGSKFQKSIEEILISPTPNYIIILGFCLGAVARGLVIALLVTLTSLFFMDIHIHSMVFIIAFILLTAFTFSLIGMLNGIYARKFDDVSIIPTFVLTPLTYLGGVFYSIDVLPEFWQVVSKFNPILYMVNGFRYGFLGISDVDKYYGLAMLCVCCVVFFMVNLVLLKRGVGLKS